jgi:arylsulfatase A-like enzyme
MARVRNILFVMCDQLRWDYLSCYGHPTLKTPNIDALAKRGVRFTNTFVQSPVCGPSRMSFYTGRYVTSHRAFGNYVPLPIDERTMGDYLRSYGIRVAVDGKTHVEPNVEGLERLGINPRSKVGKFLLEGGFEAYDRHDGILPDGATEEIREDKYTKFLKRKGYLSENPWLHFANSGEGRDGKTLSGWHMRYAQTAARIDEKHSETAYTTNRALKFIAECGEQPWCLHLSYIKPHWPYVAPAPYNQTYTADDVVPAKRKASEKDKPHPLYASYLRHPAGVNFSKDKVRDTVVPIYMGLVKQIDDHFGRVMELLDHTGRLADTMIVFTADHGDYLGDHYLGEKELWHDAVNRVPLIIYDPDVKANARRGTAEARFVESIDLVPFFIEASGGNLPTEALEGRSLLPMLRGGTVDDWREMVVAEFDYSFRTKTRLELKRPVKGCRTFTLRTRRWKYVYVDGMRPLLFDLKNDPDEFDDLGDDGSHASVRESFEGELFKWLIRRKTFTSTSDEFVSNWLQDPRFNSMLLGEW